MRSYVDWERFALRAGFAVFQKELVKEMINPLDEKSLNRIASKTGDAYADSLLLTKEEAEINSFINILRERAKRAGFAYRGLKTPRRSELSFIMTWVTKGQAIQRHILSWSSTRWGILFNLR